MSQAWSAPSLLAPGHNKMALVLWSSLVPRPAMSKKRRTMYAGRPTYSSSASSARTVS